MQIPDRASFQIIKRRVLINYCKIKVKIKVSAFSNNQIKKDRQQAHLNLKILTNASKHLAME